MEKSKTDIEILLASVQEAVKSLNTIATRIDSGLLSEAQNKQLTLLMDAIVQRLQPLDVALAKGVQLADGISATRPRPDDLAMNRFNDLSGRLRSRNIVPRQGRPRRYGI